VVDARRVATRAAIVLLTRRCSSARGTRADERKHGVTFQEAATCFDDPNVVHAEVERDAIRIVKARKATRAQRKVHEGLD
jgi:uncharacterized DUF497 family protein